ncbi:hypothetical protein MMC16_003001 [Acarospora aff. strigata]|nr:hypothetical protein [Acarospora aff. strigata]
MFIRFCTALLIFWVTYSLANVEKVIFLGPESIAIPTGHPNLDDLSLDRISPVQSSLRTQLAAEFPHENSPKGRVSWFLLEGLEPGRRYETRVCWAATQPTQFWILPYTLKEVFETPSLISSLAEYSESRQSSEAAFEEPRPAIQYPEGSSKGPDPNPPNSILLLQVFSAADYFTTNQTLMKHVPPVDVDIILDPYALNIFPKSLLPTAVYITILAVLGWFVSDIIWKWLASAVEEPQAGQSANPQIAKRGIEEEKKRR